MTEPASLARSGDQRSPALVAHRGDWQPSTHRPMMSSCVRVLRVCAMLAVPAGAFAQSTKGPTIFSKTTQRGSVALRAALVLPDYSVKPLPLLRVVAQRMDKPDSASAETDLDGRVSMVLPVGMYTLRARTVQPVDGRSYNWAVQVVVRQQHTESVQLTNANATRGDAVGTTVVAEAAPKPMTPPSSPAAAPAVPKAAAQRPAHDNNRKVVASAEPPKQTPPAPAPQPTPVASAPVASAPATTPPAPQSSAFVPPPQSAPVNAPARVSAPAPMRRVERKASRANTEGFMFGLAFDAATIRSDDLTQSTESGPGAGVTFGWGFTKNIALVLDASAARISSLNGDFDLGHVDLGGRWHFVNRTALVPFVEVGYAGRVAMKQDWQFPGTTSVGKMSMMGGGVSAGGGLQYFATPGLALGGSFKWTSGKFTRVQFDNVTLDGVSVDATSARFNMGFTWYPGH